MQNEALLAKRTDLNAFTLRLKELCESGVYPLVKMRDGTWIEVKYMPPDEEDGRDDPGFWAANKQSSLVWSADGSSITSSRFDMIELKEM